MDKISQIINAEKILEWIVIAGAKFLMIAIQIAIAGIAIRLFIKIAKKSLQMNKQLSDRKKQTLSTVFTSLIKYVIWFIVICTVLTTLGVNIASLITIASAISVAIGFGAQSLVQDIITGIFILFEDQFGIGDVITIEGLTGTVESIGIRSTRIRSIDGDVHIIPNGHIKIITNMSNEFNRATIDIGLPYDKDIDYTINIIKDEMRNIYKNSEVYGLLKEPEVLGIMEFGDSSINVRVLADTQIGENWKIEREMRRLIKKRLDKESISIPYPMRVVKIVQNDKKEAEG